MFFFSWINCLSHLVLSSERAECERKLVFDEVIDPGWRQKSQTFHKAYLNLIIWIPFTVKICINAVMFINAVKLHSCDSSKE